MLTSAWDCRHNFVALISLSLTSASSLHGKWFSVSASISPASFETCVMGRLFSTPSASTKAFLRASSPKILFCSRDFKVFFVHCTNLSHAPPKWGALDVWKFYSISFGAQTFWTLSSFSCLRNFNSSLLAPTKLVPLWVYILCGLPRRAMNLFKAIMN